MIRCSYCGRENNMGAVHCHECGTELSNVSAPISESISQLVAKPKSPKFKIVGAIAVIALLVFVVELVVLFGNVSTPTSAPTAVNSQVPAEHELAERVIAGQTARAAESRRLGNDTGYRLGREAAQGGYSVPSVAELERWVKAGVVNDSPANADEYSSSFRAAYQKGYREYQDKFTRKAF